MGGIENLPIWIVPFLTSLYFDENDKHGKNGKACVCGKPANHYRPYFCIHCEEGHLCARTCLTAGATHANHDTLQVRKVTERNSIHINDFKEQSKLDEDIMEDIREYSFNNNLVYSLLGDDVTRKKGFRLDGVDKEICKQCGRSTRALHRPPKTLCSLGCALEFKFDMSLKEIHNVQIWLREGSTFGAHHVSLHHIHMAIAFMNTMDKGNGIGSEHTLHPPSKQLTRVDKMARLSMISDAKVPPPANPQEKPALKKQKERPSGEDEIVLPCDSPKHFKRLKKAKDKVTFDDASVTLQVMSRRISASNALEHGEESSNVVNSISQTQPLDTQNGKNFPSKDTSDVSLDSNPLLVSGDNVSPHEDLSGHSQFAPQDSQVVIGAINTSTIPNANAISPQIGSYETISSTLRRAVGSAHGVSQMEPIIDDGGAPRVGRSETQEMIPLVVAQVNEIPNDEPSVADKLFTMILNY